MRYRDIRLVRDVAAKMVGDGIGDRCGRLARHPVVNPLGHLDGESGGTPLRQVNRELRMDPRSLKAEVAPLN